MKITGKTKERLSLATAVTVLVFVFDYFAVYGQWNTPQVIYRNSLILLGAVFSVYLVLVVWLATPLFRREVKL